MRKIIPAALLAASLTLAPAAHADNVFIPGTRQPGAPTQVPPHYTDPYGVDFDYVLDYERGMWPFVGNTTLNRSTLDGAKTLVGYGGGVSVINAGDTITGESQGAIVADLVKRYFASQGADAPEGLTFITYGDPVNRHGGLLAILKIGPQLIGMTPRSADMETPYDTTTYVVRYDGFADSPNNASFLENPLAWINAIVGIDLLHGKAYDVEAMKDPNNPANLVNVTTNSKGATNTYVLHTAPGYLPIVQFAQKLGLLNDVHAQRANNWLTPIIEAGYRRPAATQTPATPSAADFGAIVANRAGIDTAVRPLNAANVVPGSFSTRSAAGTWSFPAPQPNGHTGARTGQTDGTAAQAGQPPQTASGGNSRPSFFGGRATGGFNAGRPGTAGGQDSGANGSNSKGQPQSGTGAPWQSGQGAAQPGGNRFGGWKSGGGAPWQSRGSTGQSGEGAAQPGGNAAQPGGSSQAGANAGAAK